MFPPEEQEVARVRLADSLQAVVSQRLLPRADGKGRAAAVEIMLCTSAIRELIADRARVGEIRDHIEEGRDEHGMQTFDQHLMDLVVDDTVSFETARAAATNPADFERKRKMLERASGKAKKEDVEANVEEEDGGGKGRKNKQEEES
jgi:twitching motility protein PilT